MNRPKLDLLTITVRFVFGFTFGVVVGYFFMSTLIIESKQLLVLSAVIIGIVSGVMATILGDKFWYGIKDRFWW